MSVELMHLASMIENLNIQNDPFANEVRALGKQIKDAIYEHGVIDHKIFGRIFAYEVDGYGGAVLMDDANVPR